MNFNFEIMKKNFLIQTAILFITIVVLLITSMKMVFPESFWKTQKQENSDMQESNPSETLQNTKATIQTQLMGQQSNTQAQSTFQPPREVESLCLNQGEQKFVTQDSQQHTFRKSAVSIQRCDDGKIWKVVEDGAKVPDAAIFYFNENGILLDICQPLVWRSGCTRFEQISCEQKNYCGER